MTSEGATGEGWEAPHGTHSIPLGGGREERSRPEAPLRGSLRYSLRPTRETSGMV